MQEIIELSGARLPARLRDLPDVPQCLYVVGELPRAPAVAIIGSRTPSPQASQYARFLAQEIARAGVTILSGGAVGIDTQAHRGALDVGGSTVVVAPSSFERPYPERNRALFQEIVSSGGAYVSLFREGVAAQRGNFFARNAVLVALASAIIVVETRVRGGARNAAKHARELGRPVFAVPQAPWCSRGLGCLVEMELGARPLRHPGQVLAWLAAQRAHALPPNAASRQLTLIGPPSDPLAESTTE